jgi:hypothetical protein
VFAPEKLISKSAVNCSTVGSISLISSAGGNGSFGSTGGSGSGMTSADPACVLGTTVERTETQPEHERSYTLPPYPRSVESRTSRRDFLHPEREFLKFLSDIFCTAQKLNQAWMTDALRLGLHIPEVGRFFRNAFHTGDGSLGDRLSGPVA